MKDQVDIKYIKMNKATDDIRKGFWGIQDNYGKFFKKARSIWISNIENEKCKPFWDFRGRGRPL
jgi:hypothetical protein